MIVSPLRLDRGSRAVNRRLPQRTSPRPSTERIPSQWPGGQKNRHESRRGTIRQSRARFLPRLGPARGVKVGVFRFSYGWAAMYETESAAELSPGGGAGAERAAAELVRRYEPVIRRRVRVWLRMQDPR